MTTQASTSTNTAATSDADIEREVRFAVVMYGGVSLAIYINGVAQELLRLVRATATKPDAPEQLLVPEAQLDATERAYRRIARMLRQDADWLSESGDATQPVRTRFVIDIISGTSAGGLNGVFLAKALAQGEQLKALAKLWVDEGAIEKLINDRTSNDFDRRIGNGKATSLLNSRRMYRKLFDAFQDMDTQREQGEREGDASAGVALAQDIDLFVTTTDIRGLPVALRLADGVVPEMRHRNVFHFRFRAVAPAAEAKKPAAVVVPEEPVNDFAHDNNPFLAFASRCTSSFPGAFEPMTLNDIDTVLPYVGLREPPPRVAGDASPWYSFFPAYVGVPDGDSARDDAAASAEAARSASPWAAGSERDLAVRAFGDGGYLDNKPFEYAIDAVAGRRTSLPVDRKLLYVEPSPEHPELANGSSARPTVIENINAALSLARSETIRGDLERVLERNRVIERLQRILAGIDQDIAVVDPALNDSAKTRRQEFESGGLTELLKRFGAAYGGYHRLKVSALTDEITDYVVRAAGFNEESAEFQAVRHLIAAWRRRRYKAALTPQDPPQMQTENVFLWHYDLAYRIRRLDFALTRIDTLLPASDATAVLLAAAGLALNTETPAVRDAFQAALRALRKPLADQQDLLRRQRNRLLSRRTHSHPLRAAVAPLRLSKSDVETLLKGATIDARVAAADALITQRGFEPMFKAIEAELVKLIWDLTRVVATACEALLPSPPIAVPAASDGAAVANAMMRRAYWAYDRYDQLIFPAIFSTDVGQELEVIDVVRISPEDATDLVDQRQSHKHKLAGDALGHFGAFLDRRWRWNDIMWGRLDGAERLITTLLPGDTAAHGARRRAILREVHAAILGDEFRKRESEPLAWATADVRSGMAALLQLAPSDPGHTAKWEKFRATFAECYAFPRELDAGPVMEVAARGTRVLGDVLDTLADEYALLHKPATWLARAGSLAWGLVEAATPQRFVHVGVRYWLNLVLLLGTLLAVGGSIFKYPAVASFGFDALGCALAARLAILLLGGVVAPRQSPWKLLASMAVAVTALPLVVGVTALFDSRMRARTWHLATSQSLRGHLLFGALVAIGIALFTCGALLIARKKPL